MNNDNNLLNFNIESDKKTKFEFNIEVIENELKITATTLEKNPKLIFDVFLSIEEIKQNKYFSYYDDVKEVLNELESQFKIGKIFEETSQLLYVVPLLNKKISEISFILKEKEKSIDFKIDELYKIIEENENNHKKEINLLNEKIQNLENQNKILFEELNKYIHYKINEIKYKDDIEKSLILKENEIDLIKKFIGKEVNFKLLFRATCDGDTKEEFNKKCLNKQPTLALVKNHLGNRFGGYTTENWNYEKECDKKDPNSFIFSLDKKTKYNLRNNNNRAIHTKNYVIYFGNADFCLNNNFLTQKTGWCNRGTTYFQINQKDLSDDEFYVVQEFELYHVLF